MDESGFKRDSCTTSTVDDEVWLGMASTYKLSDHVPACYAGYQSIEEVMTISPRKLQREFAKIMTAACVRRGYLEKLHAGITPVSRTGDYSDVKVVDAEGREIPWNQVSRIDQAEMKTLTTGVVIASTHSLCARCFLQPKTRNLRKRWTELSYLG
jgi:hypothetical protein